MSITLGAITRSVVRGDILPVDTSLDELGEIEQQLHVAITGEAGANIAWANLDVTFDVEFLDAVEQRYSNLTEPLFTYGASMTTADPVVVSACLLLWATDDRGVITGATVAIGVHSPGPTTFAYTGKAHLKFEGFGSIPNEPADPDFS